FDYRRISAQGHREQPRAKAHRIATDWGCVALLCNPEKQIAVDFLNGWAERIRGEDDYGNVSQTQEEGPLVSDDGLLRIDWPTRVRKCDSLKSSAVRHRPSTRLRYVNCPAERGIPISGASPKLCSNSWRPGSKQSDANLPRLRTSPRFIDL